MPFDHSLIPEWGNQGSVPPADKIQSGWKPKEYPPAEYWNWQWNRTAASLENIMNNSPELDDSGYVKEDNLNLNKQSVGLDKVDNTSDLDKPISLQTKQSLDLKADSKGVFSFNLFNQATSQLGFVTSDGSISNEWAGGIVSDFIPYSYSKTYKTNASWDSGYYDSNKAFISSVPHTKYNFDFSNPPANVAYVRMSFYVEDAPFFIEVPDQLLVRSNELSNLKWAALGDSITFGYLANTNYHNIIAQRTGILPINYGVSSTMIAVTGGRTDSFVERYSEMIDDADIITVFGGTNDYGNSVPIGVWGDTVNTTEYGAMKILVEGLLTKYPTKRIGFILPTPRSDSLYPDTGLKSYIDVIQDVCARYAIPTLDLRTQGGITPNFGNTYNPDGLHPNDAGHEIISYPIEQFLKRI